ncbi:efflux RND transporter permease subunit [Ancylomarina sp. 16SWW S1-10-2]|uniref:efflux RND transporter permease subunit n=1 Tax=Ancylomarina sp. 16SWW S1-10-2 TaxID=2499681 RepID=UPI0012AD69D5|nr:efflux RND transporter permease subunit [Ancylomarina sp. 16SWW S1-10-2]MRT92817.1 efflux RND transporter permease subunit [Ancylomarina sp. 16SWW S1-10-2]
MQKNKFITRPVLSTAISIFIVILGIMGLESLPISQYPDIAPPTVTVTANYTGANAQTILNSVVTPLEEEINGVENMTYITSVAANTGEAKITVYFKQGSDADMAAVNVQNRVAKAEGLLPSEVTKVGVSTSKKQTSMLMSFGIYSEDDKYDLNFLENYMNINIVSEIKRINGVGDVNIMGTNYAMRIWLQPDVMAQHHLMPSDIITALEEQNIEAAPGQLGEQGKQSFQYVLKYKGRLQSETEFENIVITATNDGEVLHLSDIATIELGRQSTSINGKINGHNGVACMIFQTAGSNAVEINEEISAFLEEVQKSFPEGVKVATLMNTNNFLFASMWEVIKTLLEAFVLVVAVTYIFLQNFRSTLIPAIAIPVSLIGTFFFLWVFGFSINLLTLCALVLAIAIVVDDAIVVVEAVQAKLDEGYESARQASIDAMGEITGAIISITLVMMAIFIPVSFMGGTSGVFYRQMGLTLAFAIGISALNALTLSPALCAILLKPEKNNLGEKSSFIHRFHTSFNDNFHRLVKKYKKGTQFFINHKRISGGLVVLSILLFVALVKLTPTAMVPDEDQGVIFGVVTMPVGTSLEETAKEMDKIAEIVKDAPGIQTFNIANGVSITDGQGNRNGMTLIKLKDWSERGEGESLNEIVSYLRRKTSETVKNGQIMFFSPPMIPGYSTSNGFEFQLQDKTGGDINKFNEVAQKFLSELNTCPEIGLARTAFNPSSPQYMVDIDVEKCKIAGISPEVILTTLQGYYGGIYASNFNRFGKLYRVMIQAAPDYRTNIESLNKIMVRNGTKMAPITPFVNLRKVYGPDNLNRFNLYTSISIMGAPADGVSSGEAITAINELAKQLPTGYGFEFSGMTREENSTGSNSTALVLGIVFVFIYLLLSMQYESYILPIVILLSVPFGLSGSLLFANIMGLSNNIYMQIALIMLIGLLAKNSILIVEYAKERRCNGMGIVEAAIDAAGARLRPILMTSFALIIGLLPMMFSSGVGANGNSTLGAGSVGGMLIGMICQIFITPALFVIFQKIQEKIKPITVDQNQVTASKTSITQ